MTKAGLSPHAPAASAARTSSSALLARLVTPPRSDLEHALEALHPGALAEIVRKAIVEWRDDDLRDRLAQAEQEAREELEAAWEEAVRPQRERLEELGRHMPTGSGSGSPSASRNSGATSPRRSGP